MRLHFTRFTGYGCDEKRKRTLYRRRLRLLNRNVIERIFPVGFSTIRRGAWSEGVISGYCSAMTRARLEYHLSLCRQVGYFLRERIIFMARIAATLLLLIAWAGCSNQARTLSQQSIPSDTTITLSRTVCYGTCPDYTVTILADGTVTFEGRRFVKTVGTVKSSISQEKVQELIAAFEKVNYFSLKDRYATEEDGCPERWTDNPSAITSIKIDGKTKAITHYHGCQDSKGKFIYPKELTELERRIDEIVGTGQWIK